jgi:hypothetical protein
MIRRRSVMIGMCGLVAAPAIVRASSLMRLSRASPFLAKLDLLPEPEAMLFSVRGWGGSQEAIPIYLPNSWRPAWP